MDPVRIVVRVAFAFAFAFVLVRLSGKRTVHEADAPAFVVALIIGDMFDDLFWAEVPASEFVVAVGTLLLVHLVAETNKHASATRGWLRAARGGRVR